MIASFPSVRKRAFYIILFFGIAACFIVLASFINGEDGYSYVKASVERGDIITAITATGTITPLGEVKVSSQLSGQVIELATDFNQTVKQGQPLARLDPAIYAAKVRGAKAAIEVAEANVLVKQGAVDKADSDLANARLRASVIEARIVKLRAIYGEAKHDYERNKELAEKNTVSKSLLGKAKANYVSSEATLRAEKLEKQAQQSAILSAEAELRMSQAEVEYVKGVLKQKQAALDQNQEELNRTVIRAPIDGIVIGRDIEKGQTVAATLESPTLFTLVHDLRRIEVRTMIDEADIGKVRIGQPATFTVDAYFRRQFQGKVVEIRKTPARAQNVVTYTVLISGDNPDLALFPGMTATVRIVVESVRDALKLPNAALRFRPPKSEAFPEIIEGVSAKPKRGGSSMVWALDEHGHPSPVNIRIGATDLYASEVLSGPLSEGQTIIVGIENAPREDER